MDLFNLSCWKDENTELKRSGMPHFRIKVWEIYTRRRMACTFVLRLWGRGFEPRSYLPKVNIPKVYHNYKGREIRTNDLTVTGKRPYHFDTTSASTYPVWNFQETGKFKFIWDNNLWLQLKFYWALLIDKRSIDRSIDPTLDHK